MDGISTDRDQFHKFPIVVPRFVTPEDEKMSSLTRRLLLVVLVLVVLVVITMDSPSTSAVR